MNALVKKYHIDTLAGCETQCDWRQADRMRQLENILANFQYKGIFNIDKTMLGDQEHYPEAKPTVSFL